MVAPVRQLSPGYAAMNVRLEGRTDREPIAVRGDGVVVGVTKSAAERAPTGGPVPPWDIVHVELPSGVVGLGFQIVASPRGEPPALRLGSGARVHVEAAFHWHASAVLRDSSGRLVVGAAYLALEGVGFGGVEIATGPVERSLASTWQSGVRLAFDRVELDVPSDGWHRFESPLGRYDACGVSLRAELPSAMGSHRRFGIVAAA